MFQNPSPVHALFQFASGAGVRGLPTQVAAANSFVPYVDQFCMPAAAAGFTQQVWHLPGGYDKLDEQGGKMSLRDWLLLKAINPQLAATMTAALALALPHLSRLYIYFGDLDTGLKDIAGTSPAAFLGKLASCFGPFLEHDNVHLIFDGSNGLEPDSLGEYAFQALRGWTGSNGRKIIVGREGISLANRPNQWRDPGYITYESWVQGHVPGATWYPDESKLTGEVWVQQPNVPLNGAKWGADPKELWLMDWITKFVGAGYSPVVAPAPIIAAGLTADHWNRTGATT